MSNDNSYWQLLKRYTPNGSQTLSKMPNRFIEGVYPKILERGEGAIVYDLDGNSYVDLISGLGCISVGYSNKDINDRVIMQMMKGTTFSLPNILEGIVAKKLTDLVPYTDQWKFLKTGTEATGAAVRCARAFTGRDKIMTCGYHGWLDWYAVINNRNAGIPEFNMELITKAKYNDLPSFDALKSKEYAAVIIEPYVFDMPNKGFLETLAYLCNSTGTLLIFDEVVTGGRTKGFTAANLFELEPDLIVLSKGIANGHPLAAVGGKKHIMSTFERDDFFVSGTFGGECLSLAACLETVAILEKQIDKMIKYGEAIKATFNKLTKKALCKGYPTRLTFDFPTKEHKALFMQEMCTHKVLVGYSNMVMADYSDIDVNDINLALDASLFILGKHWQNPMEAIQGELPVETLRLR